MLAAVTVVFSAAPARAVLFDSTGDPTFNTTAPTGALAGSGWQYQGLFGSVLATPIAPNYFLAAKHVGGGIGATLSYGGNTYVADSFVDSPTSDLRIFHTTGTFSTYAPLYTRSDEVGRDLVVLGRGYERGSGVTMGGSVVGWQWGGTSNAERWGTNTVSGKINFGGSLGSLLYADFDHGASATEATLSSGDSSGGVFIQDPTDNVWKLAGINYGVDGPFYRDASGGGEFLAGLFDARGFYYRNGSSYELITGATEVPTSMYVTEISANMSFILSVVPEPSNGGVITGILLCMAALVLRRRCGSCTAN